MLEGAFIIVSSYVVVSLKAGGVGLNLTAASRVILVSRVDLD